MSPETISQIISASWWHPQCWRLTAIFRASPRKPIEKLHFSLGHENKSKHRELNFASFFLIGSSRFLPLFLLCSIWINATSFWSLLFSRWLFIYLFQLHPREQKPCRMATDSHVEYLFLPNLAVFSHCCHLMSLCKAESSTLWKGWGVSWVSDPHRRGVLKVKKKKRKKKKNREWEPGMDEPVNQRAGEK